MFERRGYLWKVETSCIHQNAHSQIYAAQFPAVAWVAKHAEGYRLAPRCALQRGQEKMNLTSLARWRKLQASVLTSVACQEIAVDQQERSCNLFSSECNLGISLAGLPVPVNI